MERLTSERFRALYTDRGQLEQASKLRKAANERTIEKNKKALNDFVEAKDLKAVRKVKHEESNIQKSCVEWFRYTPKYKTCRLFSVPNGSYLAGTPKERAIQANMLKGEGLLSGVSDLILLAPTGTYYLECKTESGTQSPEQKDFENAVKNNNQKYFVFRSLDEFQGLVKRIIG